MLSFIDPPVCSSPALVGVVIIGALIVVRPVSADLHQAKITRNCVGHVGH
ncbi:hypothetical protein [Rhizobium sp. CIAT894]|nr:hypothetical protein [Rhizobium sp. CIAT894]